MTWDYVMGASWIAFVVCWAVSSLRVKKDQAHHGSLWLSVGVRLLTAAAVVLLLRLPRVGTTLQQAVHRFALVHPAVQAVGGVCCASGVALAIWARATLGANWSGRPATKEGHELVTSGPYRRIRHPIYSGMLLALLGTALVSGLPGLSALVAFGAIAVYRIGVEERLMTRLFGDRYLQYKSRTRALIPFVV